MPSFFYRDLPRKPQSHSVPKGDPGPPEAIFVFSRRPSRMLKCVLGKFNGPAFDGSPEFQPSNDSLPASPGILVSITFRQFPVAFERASALRGHSHPRWPRRRSQDPISLGPSRTSPCALMGQERMRAQGEENGGAPVAPSCHCYCCLWAMNTSKCQPSPLCGWLPLQVSSPNFSLKLQLCISSGLLMSPFGCPLSPHTHQSWS